MTRVVFVILVLFQVVGVFYFFFVLKTVKFSFIADLSGPHSKPTEVNIKTLTSVKFESSCTGQWKIKTNSTVSNNAKRWTFISLFMFWASVPSKLPTSLVCKCRICFTFVRRGFNYAPGKGERDAAGQARTRGAPDLAVLPSWSDVWYEVPDHREPAELRFMLVSRIPVRWQGLFCRMGQSCSQKDGEPHRLGKESRGASCARASALLWKSRGRSHPGQRPKGVPPDTVTAHAQIFVRVVTVGSPDPDAGAGPELPAPRALSATARAAGEKKGLCSHAGATLLAGIKIHLLSYLKGNTVRKRLCWQTEGLNRWSSKIKSDGQRNKAVLPPAC